MKGESKLVRRREIQASQQEKEREGEIKKRKRNRDWQKDILKYERKTRAEMKKERGREEE